MTFYLNQLEGDAIIDMDADRKNITWTELQPQLISLSPGITSSDDQGDKGG